MTDTFITCPNCGHAIPLSEALTAQFRAQLQATLNTEHEARLKQAVAEAEARKQDELNTQLEMLRKQMAQTEQRVRDEASLELELVKSQRAEQQGNAEAAHKAELELRKKTLELEQRQREMDLEVIRRVDAEKQKLGEAIPQDRGRGADPQAQGGKTSRSMT